MVLKEGVRVKVSGFLSEEPAILNGRQKLKIGQFEFWQERYPEFHYQDMVEVVGKVKIKKEVKILGIDFKEYSLVEAEARKIPPRGRVWQRWASGLKQRFLEIFRQALISPYDGIVAGVVLGDKTLISREFSEKLRQTGTLHIMVASGMNIALISQGALKFFLLFFRRRTANLFLLFLIWFYSIMTGFSPPIVRAAILFSLVTIAKILGREAEGGRVLWLTGAIMFLWRPVFFFDVGFQLSFLATAGLIYLQPKIKEIGVKKNFWFLREENISSTLAAQLATLPILLNNFGQINLLSPVVNLAVLWVIPFLLQAGILAGIFGLLWIKMSVLAFYLIFPLLFYLKQVIDLFAKWDFLNVFLPLKGWWWSIVYYLIIWKWVKKRSCSG